MPQLVPTAYANDPEWKRLAATAINDISIFRPSTGTASRPIEEKLRDTISVKDFGAVGNGTTNDTAAIQAAFDAGYASQKTVYLPAGSYAVTDSAALGYALINRGVSVIGEGTFYSQIVPLPSMPAGSDFIRVQPFNGAYIDFLELARFAIQPNVGGTKYGKRSLFLNFPTESNLAKLHIHDLYLLAGNDYALETFNNTGINIQGIPAHSTIERNFFVEGMKLVGLGDSINISENLFRANGGNRPAIWLDIADVSGTAMAPIIARNNCDCDGGFLYMVRGRCPKIRDNNIELSHGPGTLNGAVIDIHGSSGNIPYASITDNHLGIFGTATATSAIRIATATGTEIDRNTILTGLSTSNGVLITSAATDTQIGRNEFHPNFVNPINDSGVGTMGVPVSVAPKNSWTNTGGGYQTLTAFKDANGWVRVIGVVNAPASPSGTVFATLPVSFRPPTSLPRVVVDATVSGGVSTGSIEVSTAGDITFFGSNSTTRVGVSFSFPTTAYLSGTL